MPTEVATTPAAETTTTTTTTLPPTTTTTLPEEVTPASLVASVVQIRALAGGEEIAFGSGTVISRDGLILTNAHVADPDDLSIDGLVVATTTAAQTPPQPAWEAELVASDHVLDLAVVRITTDFEGQAYPTGHIPPLEVGDSDSVAIGDDLYILGYPAIGGDTITFTRGLVSGFTGDSQLGERAWIKTDATIAGGNSGGLAANVAGELIGVPTLLGADDVDLVDCRPVRDTNRDGVVDDNDDCVPLGGFLNGLRPANLAADLIAAAETGVVYQPIADPDLEMGDTVELDVADVFYSTPFFSDYVPEPPPDIDSIWFASGAELLCASWIYDGMVDGIEWDAIWALDGEIRLDDSYFGEVWSGGPSGEMWVCTATYDALPEGIWDLTLNVGGEWVAGSFTAVGDAFYPYEVSLTNLTSTDICWLYITPTITPFFGASWTSSDDPVTPGETVYVDLPPTSYDVLADDCNGETIHVSSFVVEAEAEVLLD